MPKSLRGDRLVKAMGWLMVITGTSALVIAPAVLSVLIVSQRASGASFIWLTGGLVSVAVIAAGARISGIGRWRGRLGVALSVVAYVTLPLFPAFFLAIRAPEFVISPGGSNVAWALVPLTVVVVGGLTIGRHLINAQRKRGPFLLKTRSTMPAKIAARSDAKEANSRYRLS